MHTTGYASPETRAALDRARTLIEQAEALGELSMTRWRISLFFTAPGWQNIRHSMATPYATSPGQFLALAEKQRATVPLTVEYRLMGRSLPDTGDIAESRAHCDQAIPLYDPASHRSLATRFGQDSRASTFGEAMSTGETTKETWSDAEIHRTAGEIALMSPEPDASKAETYFERALSVARAQQAKPWELRAAMSMARLWRDQGKQQRACGLLAPVYGWFTEGFDTLDLREAEALLDYLAT
jgi:hypothetical protein